MRGLVRQVGPAGIAPLGQARDAIAVGPILIENPAIRFGRRGGRIGHQADYIPTVVARSPVVVIRAEIVDLRLEVVTRI